MIGKLPSMQFYTGDWLKDPAVRACSLAARGLWFEILCLMWESPERGVLKTGDEPWGAQETASAVGADVTLVAKLLGELKSKGVASVRGDGALYSRRMVRDEVERRNDAERQRRHRCGGRESGRELDERNKNDERAINDERNKKNERYDNTREAIERRNDDVTRLSQHSSSSVSSSSSTANLSLNFAGGVEATARRDQESSSQTARVNPQTTASKPQKDTRLEELRLQAEILGRQERLLGGGWRGAGGSAPRASVAAAAASVGTGPQPAACGVRAKAAAIERARAREEKVS